MIPVYIWDPDAEGRWRHWAAGSPPGDYPSSLIDLNLTRRRALEAYGTSR